MLKHKVFVFAAGVRTGTPYRQLLVHDLSKFSRTEWFPYVRRFYGDGSDGFQEAWDHHLRLNRHHWQHWVEDGVARPMPERYVREMVADWSGAEKAISGSWDMTGWYENESMNLHPATRKRAEEIMRNLGFGRDGALDDAPSI